jgi:hypothetical protein
VGGALFLALPPLKMFPASPNMDTSAALAHRQNTKRSADTQHSRHSHMRCRQIIRSSSPRHLAARPSRLSLPLGAKACMYNLVCSCGQQPPPGTARHTLAPPMAPWASGYAKRGVNSGDPRHHGGSLEAQGGGRWPNAEPMPRPAARRLIPIVRPRRAREKTRAPSACIGRME